MNDADLLSDYARNKSDSSFRELVSRHVDLVYSAALRQTNGDTHAAQEITQMVFIDLAKKASQLICHPLLIAWLHRSTRWAASNRRREERRRTLRMEQLAQEAVLVQQADAQPDWEQLRPLLDEALDELGAQEREAVLLRFFKNHSFDQIGEHFGSSANTARMRVSRALDKLQEGLVRRGFSSTSAALVLVLSYNSVSAAPAGLSSTVSNIALGKAGAAGLSLGALMEYFLMTKVQVAVVSVALLLSGGACLFSLRAQETRREKLEQLEAENAALSKELSVTKTRKETLDHQLSTLQARVVAGSNPTQQERFRLDLIIRKGELDYPWGQVFKKLNLPRAQLDALKALIVERNQTIWDAAQIAKQQGLEDMLPSEGEAFAAQAAAQVDERIKAFLGAAGFEIFKTQERREDLVFLLDNGGADTGLLMDLVKKRPAWFVEAEVKVHGILKAAVPDRDDQTYLAQEMLPLPEAVLQSVSAVCPPEYQRFLSDYNVQVLRESRIRAIERKAAAEGRLYLRKESAKEYGVGLKPAAVSTATRASTP